MTFAKANAATGRTLIFLAGLIPSLALGLVIGLVVGVPFAMLTASLDPLKWTSGLFLLIAFVVYCSELDKSGNLP